MRYQNLQWLLTLVIPLSVSGLAMGIGMRIGIWVFSYQYPSGYFINLSNKKDLAIPSLFKYSTYFVAGNCSGATPNHFS